ncbi:MAG: rod shape-determining protein MreC [Deltaproteobacteria bacterium]
MRLYNKYQKKFTILALVVALLVLSVGVKMQSQYRKNYLSMFFDEMATPVRRAFNAVGGGIENVWKRYVFLVSLVDENERLKKEKEALFEKLLQYKEWQFEAQRLQKLLSIKEVQQTKHIGARVVSIELTPFLKTITIDQGIIAGVSIGMPVVSPQGIVGKIIEAAWHSSRVLLITDYRSNIDAVSQEGRISGVLQGYSYRQCILKYVPLTDNIKQNDILITSGIDKIYPKGMLLGRVTFVEKKESGLFQHIEITPAVDYQKLEEVVILVGDSKK